VWILDTGERLKLDPKANKYLFVGFEDGPHAIQYYSPTTQKIQVLSDFTFESWNGSEANFVEFGIGGQGGSKESLVEPVTSEGEGAKKYTWTPTKPPTDTMIKIPTAIAVEPSQVLITTPEMLNTKQPPQVICSTRAQTEVNYHKLDNPRATKQIIPAQQARPATSAEIAQQEISAYMTVERSVFTCIYIESFSARRLFSVAAIARHSTGYGPITLGLLKASSVLAGNSVLAQKTSLESEVLPSVGSRVLVTLR
jgi:hypothetical protein